MPVALGSSGRGWISLQNLDREHAFSDSDVQLLSTLAGSLGVALENARLVHETRQRNAELALINSVQAAIAGELDPQAIYDLVGDKIQEVFDAQVVDIGIYDEASGLIRFPYTIERGVRIDDEARRPADAVPLGTCWRRKEPLADQREHGRGPEAVRHRSRSASRHSRRSGCRWPSAASRGWISLQNLDREHAFSDSDVQLLSTLAGSLGVALDNARLVHETRQRNAELALINSVQDALAGELELQAIYDVVGDKIQEVFDAQVVDIAVLRRGRRPRPLRRTRSSAGDERTIRRCL